MSIALTIGLAVAIGVSLGLLGGGGSILAVPLLVYVAGLPVKEAIATSLFAVGVTSAVAVLPHARAGRVRWRTGLVFGLGGVTGAYGGGLLAQFVPAGVLLTAFALMMLVTATAMIRGPRTVESRQASHPLPVPRVIAQGVAVGLVTGLVGAGGGFLVVPALALLGGLPMSAAIGTSLVVIAMNAVAGLAGALSHVGIDWRLAGAVTAAALLGSILGSRLAGRIRENLLRRAFGWFVVVMGGFVLAQQLPTGVWTEQRFWAATMGTIVIGVVVARAWSSRRRRARGAGSRHRRGVRRRPIRGRSTCQLTAADGPLGSVLPVRRCGSLVDMTTTSGAFPVPRLGGRGVPLVGTCRMYVCGVTPYDVTHLGHAFTFVWADAAARVLRLTGVDVEVCRNVTDVDDVLTAAAARRGEPYDRFAAVTQFRFEQDMTALAVQPPRSEPRAHQFVTQVQRLASALVDIDAGYVRDGAVYFRGADAARRAGLSQAEAIELAAEYGDNPDDPGKLDPLDVAVWQPSGPGDPAWDSPWGTGRPGWHAECAAMALSTFGPALDLHAGGADLRFPHHAYEAAMAEAVTGVRPFARAWLHVGLVSYEGHKMAKSTGNLVLVRDLLGHTPPAHIRTMLLDRPYDTAWEYTPAALDEAADRLDALRVAGGRTGRAAARAAALAALLDDLNISRAVDIAIEDGGEAAHLVASVLAPALG